VSIIDREDAKLLITQSQEAGKRAVDQGNPDAILLEQWGNPPPKITREEDQDNEDDTTPTTSTVPKQVSPVTMDTWNRNKTFIQMQLNPEHIANAKDHTPMDVQEIFDAARARSEIIVDFSKGLQACMRGLAPSTPDDWVRSNTHILYPNTNLNTGYYPVH
jgi:hypothetical protein